MLRRVQSTASRMICTQSATNPAAVSGLESLFPTAGSWFGRGGESNGKLAWVGKDFHEKIEES